MVPSTSSPMLAVTTTFVCSDKRTRRLRCPSSASTKKPRPPAMMSADITRFTVRSPRHRVRLSLHRANPALLNADTA